MKIGTKNSKYRFLDVFTLGSSRHKQVYRSFDDLSELSEGLHIHPTVGVRLLRFLPFAIAATNCLPFVFCLGLNTKAKCSNDYFLYIIS